MKVDEKQLSEYAELIVRCGVNLQKGQRLIIRNAPIESPEVVEAIATQAYRAGSPLVSVMWSSDALLKSRLRHAPEGSFSEFPGWLSRGLLDAAKGGDAFIHIISSDPELLRQENPAHVSEIVKTSSRNQEEIGKLRMSNRISWNVMSVPTSGWARRVYPDMGSDAAEHRLWKELLGFCRAGEGNTIAAWQAHIKDLELRKKTMTEKAYRELHFEGPGTDITVGLPDEHRWNGGQARTPAGTLFSPNIPTEEVFTMPHRDRVDGIVSATCPIHYGGLVITDLRLRFEKGTIVEAAAAEGQEQIDRIIATDPGSRRLGEVALVSYDSPIARAERWYFNGLIDENAASHLAIGRAYRDCIKDGDSFSDPDFERAGGNVSAIHIDFMVGSDRIDVVGVPHSGKPEKVIENGRWML
jgi:aminopeptidase